MYFSFSNMSSKIVCAVLQRTLTENRNDKNRIWVTAKCLHTSLQILQQNPPMKALLYERKRQLRFTERLNKNSNIGEDMPVNVFEGPSREKKINAYAWGSAVHGALDGLKWRRDPLTNETELQESKSEPSRVPLSVRNKIVDVSCGYGFSAFVVRKKIGRLYGCGINAFGQIGQQFGGKGEWLNCVHSAKPIFETNLPSIKKVSCGRAHLLALSENGKVYTLGNNGYGQCGRPIIHDEDYSARVGPHEVQLKKKIHQVEAGQDTSFFLTEDGEVYSCGFSADGQTGQGHFDNAPNPQKVCGDIEGVPIKKVSCRADCALALSESGDLFGWGNNEYQQLSMVTSDAQLSSPVHLKLPPSIGSVVDIGASGTACFLVNDRGELYSWGFGPLGLGPENSYQAFPQPVPLTLLGRNIADPQVKVRSVWCGVHMVAAINNLSHLYSWGRNITGCLGQGHDHDLSYPMMVCKSGKPLKISIGIDHCVMLAVEY